MSKVRSHGEEVRVMGHWSKSWGNGQGHEGKFQGHGSRFKEKDNIQGQGISVSIRGYVSGSDMVGWVLVGYIGVENSFS